MYIYIYLWLNFLCVCNCLGLTIYLKCETGLELKKMSNEVLDFNSLSVGQNKKTWVTIN